MIKSTILRSLLGLAGLAAVLLISAGATGGLDLSIHAIRPVGACESPADSDSASAYELLSGKLPSSGLTFKTNQSTYPSNLTTSSAEAAIDAAIAAWESTDVGDRLSDGGTTTARGGRRDGVNAISWGSARGAVAIAFTWVSRSTGEVVEADLVFSNLFPWSTNDGLSEDPLITDDDCSGAANAFDVQAVAAHELGHWGRVGHSDNDVQSMFGSVAYQELYKRSLAAGDTAGANSKY